MIRCVRTDSENADFRELVSELDKDLSIRDGNDHAFFAQFNKIDMIRHVVVAYEDETPVGCGAVKAYSQDTMEVKRMFVSPAKRKQGVASMVLSELENWTRELNMKKCILETGEKQPEAIALYHKSGYKVIPNFGQYADVASSVCFEKELGL